MTRDVVEAVEQALRMLHGSCPHNRPDTAAPRSAPECLTCMAEKAVQTVKHVLELP